MHPPDDTFGQSPSRSEDLPPEPEASGPAEMTPEELAEAKRYRRLGLMASLADMALDVLFLAIAALVLAGPIDTWLQGFPLLRSDRFLRLLAMTLLVFVLHLVVSLPVSYYSGYWLEHRFHLSKLTLAAWLWRHLKQAFLAIGLNMLLLSGLFSIIWTTGPWWWLVAGVGFFLLSILLGQLAPVCILPLFYTIRRLDHPELAARLARLTEGTGLTIEGVYRIALSEETVKGNALLAGLGRTRRVLLGDTLLEQFTPDEIEVLFAHEVGHHVFDHVRKLLLFGFFGTGLGFWLFDVALRSWAAFCGGRVEYAHLPVAAVPMVLLLLRLFSLGLAPLQNAVGRYFERQADQYALRRTGRKAAYVSAFLRLARLNKEDPDPPWLEVFWFHSHPPISERAKLAERA